MYQRYTYIPLYCRLSEDDGLSPKDAGEFMYTDKL
jgi:hypothetical protein